MQRASAGLIITEGIQPSAVGQGYPDTPGLHSREQVAAWRRVTDAVHAAGGRIFAQLMHAGRIGHPSLLPDGARTGRPLPGGRRGSGLLPGAGRLTAVRAGTAPGHRGPGAGKGPAAQAAGPLPASHGDPTEVRPPRSDAVFRGVPRTGPELTSPA